MKKALFFPLQVGLCTIVSLLTTGSIVQAQVTSDGTVNTIVTPNENVDEITGGETRGDNLFHSFQDFSVNTGNEASFNNADSISNIFSRVTGGNLSNIDGLIRANDANLFLINPAGILFGAGARLDLGGGSFYGSTADSILFEDGEFSATDLDNPPLLTVNAPIGLGFRDNPAEIVNRSFAQNSADEFVGLEVLSGQTLALIGGDIRFETGQATARGGNIEVGGLSEAGIVSFNENGSLSFPDDVAKANITLSNAADIDVRGTGGGNITINSQNLDLAAGEFDSSLIRAGITPDSTSAEAQAGNIAINVTENITLDDSRIINQVDSGGVGNSGNISITTGSLEAINGGDIDASTFGQGNAGAIEITATGDLTFDGEDSEGFPSGVTSQVSPNAVGDAGGVNISTSNLTLTNGGRVSASTFDQGNAGAVEITATGDLTFDGETSEGSNSGVTSGVDTGASGDSGGVTISTSNLTLTNGGQISASTLGQGNAGAVEITATGDLTFDGEDSEGFPSGVTSGVDTGASGDSGGVTISTSNLTLTNGGQISASTLGQGNAGAVEITATGDLTFDGEDSEGFPSGVTSGVDTGASGDSGGVTISTSNLTLTNGGLVAADTFGQGNAGAVEITATGDLTFDGETSEGFPSGVTSLVNPDAVGEAGGVTISTSNLTLTNGGRVAADTFGQGNAAAVEITATGDLTFDGEDSEGFPSGVTSLVNPDAVGDAGGVNISTSNLTLTNGGRVAADTFGQGNAGAIEITATGDLTFDGENTEGFPSGVTSLVDTNAVGDAGGVNISTSNLTLTNGGLVAADTFGQGNAGAVEITATGDLTFDGEDSEGFQSGVTSLVNSDAEGDAGGVNISTSNLTLTNGGRVAADTFGQGNAGDVTINVSESIFIDGFIERFRSGISANALNNDGSGGDVNVFTNQLTIANGGTIEATNFDNIGILDSGTGQPGNITIEANSIDLINAARIEAATQSETGESDSISGIINLQVAEDITLQDNSLISAQAFEEADGGNLNIDARFIIAFPNEIEGNGSDIIANAENGNGGNITISAESLLGIDEGDAINNNQTNDIDIQSQTGLDGTISIFTPDVNPVQKATELPNNIIAPEQTTAQACQANRELAAKNGLNIAGKGGVPPAPDLPLDSRNISINGKYNNSTSTIPQPVKTSQGKIQPARGIKVTEDGGIILTAYRTNNAGDRLPDESINCRGL